MNNTNNNDWSILPRNKIEFYYHVEKMKWLFVFLFTKESCIQNNLFVVFLIFKHITGIITLWTEFKQMIENERKYLTKEVK